jgi:Protein of unknown function (DUF3644)/EC042_2821-lke REase
MSPRPLHLRFVDKASAAMTSAIEIYNKPSYDYREETFSLLAINAWELLLKARLLQLSNSDARSIYVYEPRRTKSGRQSKKLYIKLNRSRTPLTLSLQGCVTKLEATPDSKIPKDVHANLTALCEIRDGAAHFATASATLRAQVLSVAVASVKNFVLIAQSWFNVNFADRLSLVLPLAFLSPGTNVESVVVYPGEAKLIEYLRQLGQASQSDSSPYDVAVRVQIRLNRSNLSSATRVQVVDDPSATPVVLTEEDILATYKWTYDELTAQLSKRYSNFSANRKYHELRKRFADDKRYVWTRRLNPRDANSGRKQFFSPNFLNEFDKHYTRTA